MENNQINAPVYFKDLLAADSQLSAVKQTDSANFFNLENIGIFSEPKNKSLHFIKSLPYWRTFVEKCEASNINEVYVIVQKNLEDVAKNFSKVVVCLSSQNLELSMVKISKLLFDKKNATFSSVLDGRLSGTATIHPTALVSPLAFIGEHTKIDANVEIMPGAHISAHCHIGQDSKIFPRTCLYPFVSIGQNCRIHAGTIIGADGFGYVFDNGAHQKIWHIGGVIIKNNVEIGANSCIDGGTFVPTVIEDGCIIDNLVQIGHNTHLGKAVVLCGQSGTAGSSKAGDYSVFGGRAALGPQCEIGKFSKIAAGAMVNKSWGDKIELGGYPARPLKEWLKGLAALKQLVEKDKSHDL